MSTRIVLDMASGAELGREITAWNGAVSLCKGGGSSTTTVNQTSTPDYAYNARLASIAERQQDMADFYQNWWKTKQAPVEEAALKSQAELLPLQTQVSKEGLAGLRGVQNQFYKAVQPKSSTLAAGHAVTDVNRSLANAQGTLQRNLSRMGVNPASGASVGGMRDLAMQGAAMRVGAANAARQNTEDTNVKNLGLGMQVGQS